MDKSSDHFDPTNIEFQKRWEQVVGGARPKQDLLAAAADDDPSISLEAVALLRRWLREREVTLVTSAAVEGVPLDDVAHWLGRTKESVWLEYHDIDDWTMEGFPE